MSSGDILGFCSIPMSVSIEVIRDKLLKIIKTNDFTFLYEERDDVLFQLEDKLYLSLIEVTPRVTPARIDLMISPSVELEEYFPMDWFLDSKIKKYNQISFSAEFGTFRYSIRKDSSFDEYSSRFINLAKTISREIEVIRTIVYSYDNLERFGEDMSNYWDTDRKIIKLTNRDGVFRLGIWFAFINLKYYGGEKKFLKILEETYEIWGRLYRNKLKKKEIKERYLRDDGNLEKWQEIYEKGVPMPRTERISEDMIFIKTVDDYYGTASEINQNPKLLKLFKKMAAEYKEE